MSTAAVLSPSPVQRFYDNNGNPLAGGTVTTFAAGTSTPIATYTDYTAGTPNPNPIVLNFRGEASIWLIPNQAYKFVVADSFGNTISTTDQITVSQLLTLYGGVDTGIANNYILNFVASFNALVDGLVVYWVPGNNNTGASTLNVNGLGVVSIINANGSALGANQIVAGQLTEVVYYQGNWQLLSISSFSGVTIGTFGPETSITAAPTTDLGSASAHVVLVTGSATITSFGASASLSAPIYTVRFTGTPTIAWSSTLILPAFQNIVVAAGDACIAQYLGSGIWKILLYQPYSYASGQSGSFTGTLTGPLGGQTGSVNYLISGGRVSLYLGGNFTGVYNSGGVTISGLPPLIRPSSARAVPTFMTQASVAATGAMASVSSAGIITFTYFNAGIYNGVSWSGTVGVTADWTITYPI